MNTIDFPNLLLLAVVGTLLLAVCDVSHGQAADSSLSVTTVNGDSRLEWQADGKRLALHSRGGGGIHVTAADPAGLLKLRRGDVILAVNGKSVPSVPALQQRLRALQPAPVTLRLRRQGQTIAVTVPAAAYRPILSSQAPQPPQP